ncbi:cysteine hydrolase [Aneurinibacillus sp. BA2021]|nr:cysteine hydrolase [Aneurinibacillus sp. BA2021]
MSNIAVLFIDVINDFEYPEGDLLFVNAMEIADNLYALKKRAKEAGIPIIYVNDNYGKWQSDFLKLVAHATSDNVRGKPFVDKLLPDKDDYFVLKPKHSGFYSTVLDTLLSYLKVETLILAGVAGNSCILFTANDAHMRDFHLYIPSDCIASNRKEDNENAITIMETVLDVDTRPQHRLEFIKQNDRFIIA